MTPIKEPCRVSTLSTPGTIFFGNVGPPGLPATGRAPRPVPASGPTHPSVYRGPLYARRVCGLVLSDSSPAAPRCFSLISRTGGGTSTAACSLSGEPSQDPCEASAELPRPQRPERAWASESLSVLHISHQQRRARCAAWCEERAGTASPEASMRAKGCVFVSPINHEKQRGDVS